MATIPERLDWLWFLGYDLDDEISDHSVLSKARTRWGVDIFKIFFEHIVWQCVEAGLVDGTQLFVDGSLVQADASNNSVINKESLKRYLNKNYCILESRLEETETGPDDEDPPKSGSAKIRNTSPLLIPMPRWFARVRDHQSFGIRYTGALIEKMKSLPKPTYPPARSTKLPG